jgi:hypothetical protein
MSDSRDKEAEKEALTSPPEETAENKEKPNGVNQQKKVRYLTQCPNKFRLHFW